MESELLNDTVPPESEVLSDIIPMESESFKVSFSVGTKLLVSVVTLLLTIILFLNVSAILLLKDDKRAYTYQTQATQAVLAGREFVNMATRSLNTLRLELAAMDPTMPVTPVQGKSLQTAIDNQSELAAVGFYLVDFPGNHVTEIIRKSREKDANDLLLTAEEFDPGPNLFETVSDDLLKNGYAVANVSKLGGAPTLAVYLADLSFRSKAVGIPVALGYVLLGKQLGNVFGSVNMSITSRTGRLLYDTDPAVFFTKPSLFEDPLFQASTNNPVMTGALEYVQNDQRFIGSYVHPGLELTVLARTDWKKANRATFQLIEKFILLAGMAVGAAVIFAILFSKTLTAPIGKLYSATQKVTQGDFGIEIPVSGGDEISALTDSFNVMSKKIGELLIESVAKAQLDSEVAIASRVQETLLPPPTFRNKQIFVRSYYCAASKCGGDWWGLFWVGNKTYIMMGDATGHGLPSALITAAARSCFSVLQKLITENPGLGFSPGKMLSYANQVIFDASAGQINMTFFLAMIDFDTYSMTYANAGHNPPWLFQKQGARSVINSLVCPGNRLGETRSVPSYSEQIVKIQMGDVLFLYTDGLSEGKDDAGEMYGKRRMQKVLQHNLSGGPEKMINGILGDYYKHSGKKELEDDVTLAIATFLEPGAPG